MKIAVYVSLVFILTFANVAPALAGEAEREQIAEILMGLNHFPSEQEKETLAAMASDESLSQAERTIAGALQSVEHFPSAEDKAKLDEIANDESAPESVRELARITRDLAHKVSADDREVLSEMTSD